MAYVQLNAFLPHSTLKGPDACPLSALNSPRSLMMRHEVLMLWVRRPCVALSSQRCRPLYAFGRGGKLENGNEASPWKVIEGVFGGLRKQLTVQDVIKEQKKKKYLEFDDDDGGDGNGTRGGGDSSGGGEDEGFIGTLDEFLQVILAAAGFSFLYFYIINGEEFSRLVKDYIRYLFGGRKSVRLTHALDRWESFLENFDTPTEARSDWLEQEILATPTWWYDPEWQRQGRSHWKDSF